MSDHTYEDVKLPSMQYQRNVKEKRYGFFRFKPSCLQCCNNPIGFLVMYCLYVMTASTASGGLLNINVSALERRFRFSSNQSALIVIGYDIGFCVLTVFLSYFGARSHRPRLVAWGALMFGLGCLIYALPHFISNVYETGSERISVPCNPAFAPDCSSSDYLGWSVGVLFLGSVLMGFGLTPSFTLGLAYIEESVSKEAAPLYLGIANAAGLMGPMIGFLAGGVFLRDYYVDFDVKQPDDGITIFDPRWVGAWWVLPLVIMGGCWLMVIPLFGFPKQLPGTDVHRAQRVSEVHKYGKSDVGNKKGYKNSVKDFPRALWVLLKNPTFTLSSLGGCFQALIVTGISAFTPKYFENNFHETLGDAALYTGSVIVPAGIVGSFIGGLIVYKFKWSVKGCLRFAGVCVLLNTILSPQFLLYCENRKVAGINSPYKSPAVVGASQLTAVCNNVCGCQEEFYVASCASDGVEYFSPCHASCIGVVPNISSLVFSPCTCANTTITIGRCDSVCTTRNIALALAFLTVLATFASVTPALLATFRVVPEQTRSFAVGVQFIFFRLLGTIPGPLLVGNFIDRTCLQWQTRQCDGTRGSCWIHGSRNMALSFLGTVAIGNFIAAIFYAIAAAVYKPASEDKYDERKNNIAGQNGNTDQKIKDLPTGTENPQFLAE